MYKRINLISEDQEQLPRKQELELLYLLDEVDPHQCDLIVLSDIIRVFMSPKAPTSV
jgi:hypothetical protein